MTILDIAIIFFSNLDVHVARIVPHTVLAQSTIMVFYRKLCSKNLKIASMAVIWNQSELPWPIPCKQTSDVRRGSTLIT